MSLFQSIPGGDKAPDQDRPLADRMRPATLEDFVGQEHILGPKKALAVEQKAINAEKAAMAQELTVVEKALVEASGKRTALLTQMDPHVVAKFSQVAKFKKGVAMATATRDGLCSACHVRLRPHVFQQIRLNDTIIQCESCQRILYYIPPPAAPEPSVTHPS